MRILVQGAGVIGQVYAGRLHQGGHAVTVLARGRTHEALVRDGITLSNGERTTNDHVRVVERVGAGPDDSYDLVLVAVRRDQIDGALPALKVVQATTILFLLNHPSSLAGLREAVGPERAVFGFPGVGGQRTGGGAVRYLEIPQQPTTLGRCDGREEVVASALTAAGLTVTLSADIEAWLKTHAIFIATIGAAINSCGGDSSALAADSERMRTMVRALQEGFRALASQGVDLTPTALRVLFTMVPTPFVVRYWRRQLRGDIGRLALAPHVWKTRDTELAALTADVQDLLRGGRPTPHLDVLLSEIPSA